MHIYVNVSDCEVKENLDKMTEQTTVANLTTTEMSLESLQISAHKSKF